MPEAATVRATTADAPVLHWLALSLTPGLGPLKARKIADHFGSAENVLKATLTELEGTGIQAVSAQSLATGRSQELAHDELARAAQADVSLLCFDDPAYPAQLKQIYDPPLILYVRGNSQAISQPGIAVVGTRHPTPYGLGMAERLACDLAARGLVIFSGLARGVDAAAHRGAITAKGKTVAVFGTGVDEIYPKENRRLVEQMLGLGGAIISEFPLSTFPAPQNFPIRNRIISGISLGVLVVEAAEYSGTRITSRCALEQNRDIYAVPGNVTNKNSWGPNTLIKQGAKLVATWDDVWEELPADVRLALQPAAGNESNGAQTASLFGEAELGPHERKILRLLKADEATHIDEVVEKLDGSFPLPKSSPPCLNWNWQAKSGSCPARISSKAFSSWLLAFSSSPRAEGCYEKLRRPASLAESAWTDACDIQKYSRLSKRRTIRAYESNSKVLLFNRRQSRRGVWQTI